jgi:protein-S-isoprenylcysteine O-methyltransferase Ste14
MHALENRVPPIIVMAVAALVAYLASLQLPLISIDKEISTPLGLMFSLMGVCLIASGTIEFKRHKTTVDPTKPNKATSLVASGIYKLSRNPMYLGIAAFLIAFAFFMQSLLILLSLPLFILYMTRFQIAPEERAMHSLFGEQYQQYKAKVRRWL